MRTMQKILIPGLQKYRGRIFADARLTDIQKLLEKHGESQAKFIESYQSQALDLQERVEILESDRSGPGKIGNFANRERQEYNQRFLNWVRRPHDGQTKRILEEAQSEVEKKNIRGAVTIGTPGSGGYAVPEEISSDIEARVKILNPFRSLVTVRQIGTSRYHELVSMGDDSSGWVGESGTRSETDTPTLRDREPTIGTIYAYPKASEESLNDIFFNVRGWLVENASDSFASEEAKAIVSGNGTSKPTGFINSTPVTTDDDASPLRAAGTLQYVAGLAGSPEALSADALIDLATASIKERYLMGEGVAWVCHRTALSQIRQLKDSSGRYIWAESLVPGMPGTLLGYPIYPTDAMEAVATDKFPIAFGNWRRSYVLVDLVGLTITVDANITTPGQVKFYIRRREGGIIRNNDALRVVKWAAS